MRTESSAGMPEKESRQRKKAGKRMLIALVVLLAIAGSLGIWFGIPYSPLKKEFQKEIEVLKKENRMPVENEIFTEAELSHLPMAIQNYMKGCGYVGTRKMSHLKMEYHKVFFSLGKDRPSITIDYTQYDFVKEPCRMALIDSRMFGVPFEGCDYYKNGTGGMKGVLAKGIPLFDRTGAEMDQACLVTFLAESMFAPAILLQEYISLMELSSHEVQATIHYKGQTASGIFTFNDRYEMISFTTKDRAAQKTNGEIEYVPWSALCGDYRTAEDGRRYPTKFQAVWNYPEGDFLYFDGVISDISYGYEK